MKQAVWFVTGIILALLLTGCYCDPRFEWGAFSAAPTATPVPLAPTFALPDVVTGETVDLAAYRGQVVVLTFTATWCVPCQELAPVMQSIAEQYADQPVVFIDVFVGDAEPDVQAFIDRYGVTTLNVLDADSTLSGAYRITGVPEVFIVDRAGGVVDRYLGAPGKTTLRNMIESTLAAVSGS